MCEALELPGITIANTICEALIPDFGIHEAPVLPTPDLPLNIKIIQHEREPLPSYPEHYKDAVIRSRTVCYSIIDKIYVY